MPETLPIGLRRWAVLAALACLLPLLPLVPPGLAMVSLALAALGLAVHRPWPGWLRGLLLTCLVGYVLASHEFRLGRDTGCALLACLLAIKPLETRSVRDAHSLLGFSLFAPFAAFLQDQGPLSLGLALPAVAVVLAVLALLAEGGDGRSPGSGRARLRQVGFTLLMALPLAAAGFWLFPRLASPLWGMPENALGRSGLGESMTPDRWIDLFADDAPVLRARFDGQEPARPELYWRAQVLSRFDGRSWDRGLAPEPQPPRVRSPLPPLRYRVTLEPTDRRYLVTLDIPLASPADGQLRRDGTVLASAPVSRLVSYDALSAPGGTITDAPTGVARRQLLSLPPDLNPRTLALARQWRRELGEDDTALVARALDWIASDFSYSLHVPPSGRHAVDEFLFDSRVGFCQHFSSSFAVLMRAAGIPSRVVIGYAGGYRNPIGGYWIVRSMDAHAWTEIWLEGRGWVRVDPTAAVRPERVLDTVQDLARREALLPPDALLPLRNVADWVRRGWNDFFLGFNAERQAGLLRPLGLDRADALQLAAAFAAGAALALGLTLWLMLRGRRQPHDPLRAAWRRFDRRLARAGLARHPWEPPLSFGERAAAAFPAHAEILRSLSGRYARHRYAPGGLPAQEQTRLADELDAFRPSGRGR
ncbi:transglutaminase TgpA family protein [Arenimonas fontis]|uniref:DUF3488 domain-containing protein n=1 Tax=Arenimonas fontis TaxID=2608255 RepID=A0A5B2ZCI7_9GAMM|nr:DUF3488 and transglutaminase-like domain-containing protein [Arenimonas fontis]KAA2285635.1 DUF3488 domain-containing protein [Arenimonas fontis]